MTMKNWSPVISKGAKLQADPRPTRILLRGRPRRERLFGSQPRQKSAVDRSNDATQNEQRYDHDQYR